MQQVGKYFEHESENLGVAIKFLKLDFAIMFIL